MKAIFLILISIDVAVLLLFFVLGLAAAPSSGTSSLSVAAAMLPVPALFILASIVLFTCTTSSGWRGLAVAMAALPWLIVIAMKSSEEVKFRLNSDASGNMTYFRAGPLRDLANAISSNDAAAVAALAPTVNVNAKGYVEMTPLMFTFRQLRETPRELGCLRALMKAGPDPNLGTEYESPLETAIQLAGRTGPEPVELLLAAGANPNRKNKFGAPAYFSALGLPVDPKVLDILLAHGADVSLTDGNGLSVAFQGANCGNWQAVLRLLEKGAPWKGMRGANGLSLTDTAESYLRVYGDHEGLKEVIAYLHAHAG